MNNHVSQDFEPPLDEDLSSIEAVFFNFDSG